MKRMAGSGALSFFHSRAKVPWSSGLSRGTGTSKPVLELRERARSELGYIGWRMTPPEQKEIGEGVWAGKAGEKKNNTHSHPHPMQILPHSRCDMGDNRCGCRSLEGVTLNHSVPAAEPETEPRPGDGQAPRTHQVLHSHSLQGVVPLGRLSRQHDAVGSVQNGIGHITALSPGGTGLLDHALQHLEGDRTAVRRGLGCL